MKARKVSGLDPEAALADSAERIVRVRLDELCGFMPTAADPEEIVALHDMRIAAKRLRYILEITGPCFGPYAKTATKMTKDLQDLLGEIHDCDVQIPATAASAERLLEADAEALVGGAGEPPHRDAYGGMVALIAYLHARRALLYDRFLDLWLDLERKGFAARLRYALTERPA